MTTGDLITTVEQLHYYLVQAMKLEHATIPPYLTALYSLKPGTNLDTFHIIRTAVVEEMLHLTLVANVLNAVGGNLKSTLTAPDFIPEYPTKLPANVGDFLVGLSRFSQSTLKTFLQIEKGDHVPEDEPLVVSRSGQKNFLRVHDRDSSFTFSSIGAFYAEIIRSLYALHQEKGNDLFCGQPERQITPEYYYNGGGDIIVVSDLPSAIRALKVIQEQGEGSRTKAIYDAERELSHYYRFQQLELGQYYVVNKNDPEKSNQPNHPNGGCFQVDWQAVYPLKDNAKLSDYPEGSELYVAAKEFQSAYSNFLAEIEYAFDGHPQQLIPSVGGMFRLKELANHLIRNPIPGTDGENAAPIFRSDCIHTSDLMEYFLDLSVYLTGFSRFHLQGTGQAVLYFNTTLDIIGKELFASLLQTFNRLDRQAKRYQDESLLTQGFHSEILESEKFAPIVRNIIKLWYVATWYKLPEAWQSAYGIKGNDDFIPSAAAYPEGLLSPTIGVNPPGAKRPRIWNLERTPCCESL